MSTGNFEAYKAALKRPPSEWSLHTWHLTLSIMIQIAVDEGTKQSKEDALGFCECVIGFLGCVPGAVAHRLVYFAKAYIRKNETEKTDE